MDTRLLTIDSGRQGPLVFSLEAGTLTICRGPDDGGVILRDLHIGRLHCEIEIDDESIMVDVPANPMKGEAALHQELRPGQALDLGAAYVRLRASKTDADAGTASIAETDEMPAFTDADPGGGARRTEPGAATPPATPAGAKPTPHLRKRLFVVDGADEGRIYGLPDVGTVTIGKSHKHADVPLNDLYVARIHCQLDISDEGVLLGNVKGHTLVNGKPATKQPLQVGDIVRVGNTHLRLETIVADARPENARPGTDADEEVTELEIAGDGSDVEVAASGEASVSGESFPLPHAPVDQLLQLEEQTLGNFAIGPLLGRGQSSLIFRAQDHKRGQTVALKVLSPDFPSNDSELQRFVQSLRSATQFQHTHLVTLYGAGRSGPYCWIAREFIEGESAARVISRIKEGESADWARACRVAVHLGNVLDFLHRHGVTHGNISPRNILIAHGDRVTKLTDFMLNQALHGSRLEEAIRGKRHHLQLPYLPPERTDPDAPDVSPVADLYTLGSVLYALLTGRPPFQGHSPKEVLVHMRDGKVVKPRKFLPSIPVHFETAVLKMMARTPSDRFQSAADMLAAVEPIAILHEVKV